MTFISSDCKQKHLLGYHVDDFVPAKRQELFYGNLNQYSEVKNVSSAKKTSFQVRRTFLRFSVYSVSIFYEK